MFIIDIILHNNGCTKQKFACYIINVYRTLFIDEGYFKTYFMLNILVSWEYVQLVCSQFMTVVCVIMLTRQFTLFLMVNGHRHVLATCDLHYPNWSWVAFIGIEV